VKAMRAMQLKHSGEPLAAQQLACPEPGPGQVLIRVNACGVCRTDLHILDGELSEPRLPLVPGHEIIGHIEYRGAGVAGFELGQRVGVPWLGHTCGQCTQCKAGRENLCDRARFTGYHLDGGYAEYTVADHRYCLPVPGPLSDAEAAPLLCAGLIGYRALRMASEPARLGIYGFGAAAHIVIQIARHQGRAVYVFTRPGDIKSQQLAHSLGATWAGGSDQPSPELLDAAILFAPVGALVPAALASIAPGGMVVCAGIHMSDIPAFPYQLLWRERMVRSVANLTRRDGIEFLDLAGRVPVRTHVTEYPLAQANQALDDLRHGRFQGAGVLTVS